MAGTATRWSLVVTSETDSELRQFLASEGGGRKGDLSELSARRAKAENEMFPAEAIDDAVREALAWARKR
jgi:hypothetical protein